MEHRSPGSLFSLLACLTLGTATLPFAEEPERGPEIHIGRAAVTDLRGRRPVRRRVDRRRPRGHLVRDAARGECGSQGPKRRLPRLRRPVPLRRVRVLRSRPVAHPGPVLRPGQHHGGHRLRRDRPRHPPRRAHRDPVPRDAPRHPVRRRPGRCVRGRELLARTSTGTPRERSPRTAGSWRSASRSLRSGTTAPAPGPGASSSSGTTRATTATQSSRRSFPGGAPASSATSTC